MHILYVFGVIVYIFLNVFMGDDEWVTLRKMWSV